ncbi:sensor histidine kinase [Streptomyces sp. NPDC001262]|uniref:sensor histidine kinase n=1 Tax=Streptomyces sp. NPDC001262 TaxID=3364552 RepID=UPI00368A251D
MDATSWARGLWRRVTDPVDWPRRRLLWECLLAAVLALLVGWGELAGGHGLLRSAGAAVGVAVLSLVRRGLPVTTLVAVSVLSAVTDAAELVLPLAAWSAGRRIDGVLKALGAFGTSLVLYVGLSLWTQQRSAPFLLVLGTLFFLVFAVVPGLASRYWTQRRTLLQTLQERNAHLLRERQMIAGQARMRERQRIAQDMHDSLGHQLALIAVQTGALEVDRELTGRQREAVAVLRQASVAAMHELREVVGILKDGTLGEDSGAEPPARVVAGIGGLVDSAVAAGMRVTLERSGEVRPLAPAVDHAGYRIVQEGLTNAYKHAPGTPITVAVRFEPDSLVVEVANGPAGPDGPVRSEEAVSGGQGLTGLRERARLVGGIIFAGPVEGGFRLAGMLPYGSGEARATFVDTEDDLRQQPAWGTPGEGGPVIDRLDPREEFKDIMSTRKSNGCVIGCGIALLILVGLAALAFLALGKTIEETDKAMLDRSVYDSVKVGEPEQQVRDRLPSGKSVFTADLKDKGPAQPAGASCLSLLSSEGSKGTEDTVFRFCFKDGKLIEKREFDVQN